MAQDGRRNKGGEGRRSMEEERRGGRRVRVKREGAIKFQDKV